MKSINDRSMPSTELANESGAMIATTELSLLSNELKEIVSRCSIILSPILRPEQDVPENPTTCNVPSSELFNSIYCHATDCLTMIAHLHSILDRVDL